MQRTRRQVRRFMTSPRTAVAYAKYLAYLRRRDWAGLRTNLRALGDQALRANDTRMLKELGQAAWRLDEYQLGIDLVYAARRRDGSASSTDWAGKDISDATLIVDLTEGAGQAVVAGVHIVGYVRAAAERAARTVMVVEPRMAPLFARTLPGVIVLPAGADPARYATGRIVTATIIDLQYIFGFDAATIARLRVPLLADMSVSRDLRQQYRSGRETPLIGISWWSSHPGKDVPELACWRQLIDAVPAQFVSLQYGDISDAIREISRDDPSRLIADQSVDQLKDMDRFASQIAALDLVVTISNSGGHLAAALGQRMILVRDDRFRRSWPYLGSTVPWQPRTTVIGKDNRPWSAMFTEVIDTARMAVGDREEVSR